MNIALLTISILLGVIAIVLSIINLNQMKKLKRTTPRISKNTSGDTILKDENNKTIYIN